MFIDYHCHLLPNLDDGASDPSESVQMARILAEFGYSTVHCTPHRIKGCFDNDPARVVGATQSLQRLLEQEGIPLQLVPGTEHYLDEFLFDFLPGTLTVPHDHVLVEAPFKCSTGLVTTMVTRLQAQGLTPLIAHPERCDVFAEREPQKGFVSKLFGRKQKPLIAESLILQMSANGCRFQGNLGSFAGYYGSDVKERAILFLQQGIYSCLGSDAHRSERLLQLLHKGFETVAATVGKDQAHWLMTGGGLIRQRPEGTSAQS